MAYVGIGAVTTGFDLRTTCLRGGGGIGVRGREVEEVEEVGKIACPRTVTLPPRCVEAVDDDVDNVDDWDDGKERTSVS